MYEYHPIADLFPMMSETAFAELVADISEHGLHEPIIIHEGKILDGRNRYRACLEAEVEPTFERYDGEHPVAFVISLNLHRRHLNESQRAMVAAKLAKMERGSNQHTSIEAPSRAEAASLLNVGRASVERAKTVLRDAIPEVIDAVEQGDLAVSAAAKIAKEAAEVQANYLKLPTPKEAKRQAIETGKTVVGRDGVYHTPMPSDEVEARRKLDKVWNRFYDALETLSTLPPPADVLSAVPSFQHRKVASWLPIAATWLSQFQEIWNEAADEDQAEPNEAA